MKEDRPEHGNGRTWDQWQWQAVESGCSVSTEVEELQDWNCEIGCKTALFSHCWFACHW